MHDPYDIDQENRLGQPPHESTYDPVDGGLRSHQRVLGRRGHGVVHGSWWDVDQENCLGQSTYETVHNPWGISYQNYLGRPVLGRSEPEARFCSF